MNVNACGEILRGGEKFSTTARVSSGNDAAPIRIWMVDDNSALRALLASLLNEELGFDCEQQFPSPSAVLEALAHEAVPDVILLDIEMGCENGLDAIRPIKVLAPRTHVLMLTTFAGPSSRERAFREGASDFMLKSWPVQEISMHIRRAMEFGSAAGLMAALLDKAKAVEKPIATRATNLVQKTSGAERWLAYLRGWVKLSPS